MSGDACCGGAAGDSPGGATGLPSEEHPRWWRDVRVLIPLTSGFLFAIGLCMEWAGMTEARSVELGVTVVFWASLLLGASQFVPGALRRLIGAPRRLGIGLLMTISATGAVILGHIEEAAALAFLYSLAEALEGRAMRAARVGLRALLAVLPETAVVVDEAGRLHDVPAETVVPGQFLRLRSGDRLATDGVIRSGRSSLDTSAITGESIPVEVGPGDEVSAGSVNGGGFLDIVATAPGSDNSLTTVVRLVEQAQAVKGDRARIADRIARPLVPAVLLVAVVIAGLGSVFGDPSEWLTRAIVVLVAASPCALAISVPITVISAIGGGSRFGFIVKSGDAFERLGDVDHVAFDKTGTLTRNEPRVSAVAVAGPETKQRILDWAAAIEAHSSHPLAAAITSAASSVMSTGFTMAEDVVEHTGQGLTGVVAGVPVAVGSPRWLSAGALAPEVTSMEAQGRTVVVVHAHGHPVGAIAVRDELRAEVPMVVEELHRTGTATTMLTGDNALTARNLAERAGIAEVRAELRPEDKVAHIDAIRRHHVVAMIGDGINDAPALATADVGIAMGARGSDAAIESADVAFTGDDLRLIPRGLAHARRGRRIMNQNLVLSLAVIAVLQPLALFDVIGLAAVVLVHELAEVLIIGNGLRASRAPRSEAPVASGDVPTHGGVNTAPVGGVAG